MVQKRKVKKGIIGFQGQGADSYTDRDQHQESRTNMLTIDAGMLPLYNELKKIRILLEQLVAKK